MTAKVPAWLASRLAALVLGAGLAAGGAYWATQTDDEALRDSMTWMLEGNNYKVATYDSADAFLRVISPVMVGCVVLDVRIRGQLQIDADADHQRRGGRVDVEVVELDGGADHGCCDHGFDRIADHRLRFASGRFDCTH